MTEIEAVARAVCDYNPDAETFTTGWTNTGWGPTKRLEEPRPIKMWRLYEAKARKAIEALDRARGEQNGRQRRS